MSLSFLDLIYLRLQFSSFLNTNWVLIKVRIWKFINKVLTNGNFGKGALAKIDKLKNPKPIPFPIL